MSGFQIPSIQYCDASRLNLFIDELDTTSYNSCPAVFLPALRCVRGSRLSDEQTQV